MKHAHANAGTSALVDVNAQEFGRAKRVRGVICFVLLLTSPGTSATRANDAVASSKEPSRAFSTTEVTPHLLTGRTPPLEATYHQLASMGVRSVLSVDGHPTDVAAAEAANLTAVHIPIGYSSITADNLALLARASIDLPRPIYIHCHRGHIRGPAVAALFAHWDGVDDARITAALTATHFDDRYENLRSSIGVDRPAPSRAPLRPVSRTTPLAAAMLQLDAAVSAREEQRTAQTTLLVEEAVTEVSRAAEQSPTWDDAEWMNFQTHVNPFNATSLMESCTKCHASIRH